MPPTPHERDRVNRLVHLLALLASNAVPVFGWFFAGWSAATTLVVFWFETVAALVFIYTRGVLHRRWNPRRGHFRYEAPERRGPHRPFLTGFFVTSLVFCAAHGFFIGVILLVLSQNGDADLVGLDWGSARAGCTQVLIVVAIDFLADLPFLRTWSFGQLEHTAHRSFGRIGVVHFALIFGMFGAAVSDAPATMFSVFIVLKVLYSLGTALPQGEPKTPPAWLSRAMNRARSEPAGQRFEDMWVKDRAADVQRRARNEQLWTDARR